MIECKCYIITEETIEYESPERSKFNIIKVFNNKQNALNHLIMLSIDMFNEDYWNYDTIKEFYKDLKPFLNEIINTEQYYISPSSSGIKYNMIIKEMNIE